MHITQDEAERLIRVVQSYEQLVRILLDRPKPVAVGTINDIMGQIVEERLTFYHWHTTEAAASLGISRNTLFQWTKRCGVTRPREGSTGVVDSAA